MQEKLCSVLVVLAILSVLSASSSAQGLAGIRPTATTTDGGVLWRYGATVVGLGDVNSNGSGDVLIGAPDTPSQSAGAIEVIDGATHLPVWSRAGNPAFSKFGGSVARFDDVDGDGVSEVVLTSVSPAGPLVPATGVEVIVLSGATGSPVRTLTYPVLASRAPPVAVIGDVNGDGVSEVALAGIGFPASGLAQVVILDLVSGSPLAAAPTGGSVSPAPQPTFSIASGADVNGDGLPEIAIGLPGAGGGLGQLSAGQVMVFDGGSLALLSTTFGQVTHERMGASLVWTDDLNGDNVPELVAGAPGVFFLPEHPGGVYVIDGQSGAIASAITSPPGARNFGSSLSRSSVVPPAQPLGRVIVGMSPLVSAGQNTIVAMDLLLLGATPALTAQPITVTAATTVVGPSVVAEVDDLNGDGRADVVIGVPGPEFATGVIGQALFYRRPFSTRYGTSPPFGPDLQVSPHPTAWMALSVSGVSLTSSTVGIVVGVAPANVPVPGGTLLVDVATSPFAVLSGPTPPIPTFVAFSVTIPAAAEPMLRGETFYFQGVVTDGTAFETSEGVQVTF